MTTLSVDALLALWTAQDGLLQQYRSIFIAVHAAMLSAGGLMVGHETRSAPFVVLAMVALFLLPIWVSTCRKRAALAQAAQYMLVKAEDGIAVHHPLRYLRMAQTGETLWLIGDPLVDKFVPATKLSVFLFEKVVPSVFLLAWLALAWAHFTPIKIAGLP